MQPAVRMESGQPVGYLRATEFVRFLFFTRGVIDQGLKTFAGLGCLGSDAESVFPFLSVREGGGGLTLPSVCGGAKLSCWCFNSPFRRVLQLVCAVTSPPLGRKGWIV